MIYHCLGPTLFSTSRSIDFSKDRPVKSGYPNHYTAKLKKVVLIADDWLSFRQKFNVEPIIYRPSKLKLALRRSFISGYNWSWRGIVVATSSLSRGDSWRSIFNLRSFFGFQCLVGWLCRIAVDSENLWLPRLALDRYRKFDGFRLVLGCIQRGLGREGAVWTYKCNQY